MINVFIVGAQKSATTTIKSALQSHPDVICHEQLEMTHFYNDFEFEIGAKNLKDRYGLTASDGKTVVAKHAVMTRSEDALKRLANHNPNCKIIYCTRNPVNRAFSSYLMEKRNGSLSDDFDTVVRIALEEKSNHWYYRIFIELGLYREHINKILKFFPEKNLYTLRMEDLKGDQHQTLSELIGWLNLSPLELESRITPANTRDEISSTRVKLIFKNLPFLKDLMITIFGRDLINWIAKNISKLFGLGRGGNDEKLEMYPKAKKILEEFYGNY